MVCVPVGTIIFYTKKIKTEISFLYKELQPITHMHREQFAVQYLTLSRYPKTRIEEPQSKPLNFRLVDDLPCLQYGR